MMTRFQMTIPENLKEKLEGLSEETGLSQAEIARQGILKATRELTQD
ncbi:MAG: ribbon-helix-helix domain-containing protein [Candidatus Nanohaloarchaea archaeon]